MPKDTDGGWLLLIAGVIAIAAFMALITSH